MDKIAGSRDLENVLMKNWNNLHDLEHDLKAVIQTYDEAASFPGKGKKDALEMIKKIKETVAELSKISSGSNGSLQKLLDAETSFQKAHGDVEDYIDSERNRFFPRAASFEETFKSSSAELDQAWSQHFATEKKRFWVKEDRRGEVGDPKGYPSVAAAKKAINNFPWISGYGPAEKWKSTITPKWEAWYGGPANAFEIKSWKGDDRPK